MIGFHTGPAGNARGLGEYFTRLDNAGIPAMQKAVDSYGPCNELAQLARKSGVNHNIVFRLSTAGQDDGRDYDVPNYLTTPETAAFHHWQMTLAKLPPEFDQELTWLEVINEVDKNKADWLGRFGIAIADLAIAQGYKIALFGFSSGEPNAEHWQEPGMINFLDYAGHHPDRIAVSLHEYTLDREKTMQEADHWWIGRYRQLYKAVDQHNIQRPTILITEYGWEYQWNPAPSAGLPQIQWANDTYYAVDRIPAALWYLGGGFGNIANKTQPYIEPVTELMLSSPPPPPPPPPDPPEPPPPDPPEPPQSRQFLNLKFTIRH
jgi:hypothetical protein